MLLYYNKLDKISLNQGGSYRDSLKWLENKKATINHKNNDDKCFQNSIGATLSLKQIESHLQRIPNTKPFINQYNWERINFLSDKNDKIIAIKILHVCYNNKEIRPAYVSKHNLQYKN